MRYRHLRRTVIAVLATVAFVLLLGLLLRIVLEAKPTRRLAIHWIEQAAAGYGARLEIEDLHWGLLPPRAHLHKVNLKTAGISANVNSLRVSLGRMWLTRRTVELGNVSAQGIRISVSGLQQRQERRQAPIKFQIRRLNLNDIEFEGVDLPGGLGVEVNGVRAGWTTEDNQAQGFAELEHVKLFVGTMDPFEAALKVRYSLVNEGLEIAKIRIDGKGFDLEGHGNISTSGIYMEAAGGVDIDWLDREIKTHGLLSGHTRISAVLDTTAPELIQVEIRAPHVEAAGFPIDDVKGRLVLEGGKLRGTLAQARFHGGVVSGSYELGKFGGEYPHKFVVHGKRVALKGFLDDIHVDSAGLAATMDLTAEGAWNGRSLPAGLGHASIVLNGTSPGLPLGGVVEIDLTGEGYLLFNAEDLAIGHSVAQWQGVLTLGSWEPAWSIAARPAVFEEIGPMVNAWVGSTILPEGIAGTGELQVNLSGPFKELVVTARVDAQPLLIPPIQLDRLVADATISNSSMRLGSARFQVADGFGEVEGGITWHKAVGEEQLDLDIRGRHIPLTAVTSWIDLEQWVEEGLLSFAGGLHGPVAAPRGSWAVVLSDLNLEGLDLGDSTATIDLFEGLFSCHDLRSTNGLDGQLSWDVHGSEIEGMLTWLRMPLAIFGETMTRMAGDFADVELDLKLPLGGRPIGELVAVSEHAWIEAHVKTENVQIEAGLTDAAQVRADLTREPDGALHGPGELVLSSAKELVEHLAPAAGVPLSGKGRATFNVNWGSEAWPQLTGKLENLDLTLEEHPVHLIKPANFSLSEDGFVVAGLQLQARDDEVFLRWAVTEDGSLRGNVSGTMDTLLLRFLLPDWEPAGRATGVVELLGSIDEPRFEGIAEIHKGSFRLPGTRTILSQVQGTVLLSSGNVLLEGMDFRFMQGRGNCSGSIQEQNDKIALSLRGTARGIRFSVLPNLDARLSGTWRLIGPIDDLLLSGEVDVDRMTLGTKDDLATLLLAWLGNTEGSNEDGGIRLDLHVNAEETIDLRNPFVRLTGSASLSVTGTSNRPGLVGQIEVLEGGEATLLGNRYEIERGSLSFSNPEKIDPFLDLQASTWVQEFQITVHLAGTFDRFVPSVVSTPPLNAPDIYSLLGLGYRSQDYASSAVGFGLASSIISSELTSVLSRRAQLVLPVDQVRVDPFSADSTGNPTARVSVIKQLTPSWTVILQSTLSGEREQIVVSRWYIAPGFFIEAGQHEDGSLTLDLKLRRPY